jgi:hypothetical protein
MLWTMLCSPSSCTSVRQDRRCGRIKFGRDPAGWAACACAAFATDSKTTFERHHLPTRLDETTTTITDPTSPPTGRLR